MESEPSPEAHDTRRVQAMDLADRLAQDLGAAFGIDVKIVRRFGERLHRLGAGTKRRFVGRELDGIFHAGHGGASAHIGRDIQDAGLGRGRHINKGSEKGRY